MVNRIVHIILALLILVSSNGFVVNKHYCQKELKSIALFVPAEGCHQAKAMKNCPMHSAGINDHQNKDEKKGCCDDETEYIKLDEEQIPPSVDMNFLDHLTLLPVLFVALQLELPSLDARSLHYLHYKPPLIVYDLSVSLQTFRC
ncbi:MAG: hypothetical protein R2828_09875 [Saprospiraceae bacterium]